MSKARPPKLADRFFKWYCRNELRESVLGDLQERFDDDLTRYNPIRAKWRYWLNVFRFINRHTLKRHSIPNNYRSNQGVMIANYLLTSFRYLRKHGSYSTINIIGLSIGLASCLLIFNFLKHEVSFDQFHDNQNNIYRIVTDNPDNSGNYVTMVNTAPALAPGLRGPFPEVRRATQLRYALRSLLNRGDKSFYEDYGFYADSSFLEVLTFKLKSGDASKVLDEPNSIVMTETMASKYFEDSDPIGELITMNNNLTLKVTGILEEIPSNSHIRFDFLVSFSTYQVPDGYFSDLSSWRWLGFLTYVELNEGADPIEFKSKLDKTYVANTRDGSAPQVSQIQPLTDIYLGSLGMVDDLASHLRSGNKITIYALGIIAILILSIAGFNFMNLTVAFSVNRGKEMGLRKVLGADKKKLIFQLLTESVLVAILSLAMAYLMALVTFPYLKDTLQWDLLVSWNEVLNSIPYVLAITILLGISAGLYPSILLSSFKTVDALKGKLKLGQGGNFKNVLVIFQFCISIALIASTIVITKQISYLRDQSLGFDRENVMVIKLLPSDMTRYYETFKNTLLQKANVLSVSRGERKMGDPWPPNPILVDGQDRSQAKQVIGNLVDYDFLKTMGIELVEGRSFSKEFVDDSTKAIIISEKAVAHLGLQDPVGKKLRFFTLDGPRTVIGVMKDFNFSSLHNGTSPTVLIMPFIDMEHLFVRITPGNLSQSIALVEQTWDHVASGIPLDIRFMDDDINSLYDRGEKLGYLISGFSIVAVILACLGLYGLVAFMVHNRIKEVGVRKVLGASVISIVKLFSQKYVALIGISSIIAIPGLHFLLNSWLQGFAYRTDISWWIYAISTLAILAVALTTIGYQTIKAALTNPVKVLRNE